MLQTFSYWFYSRTHEYFNECRREPPKHEQIPLRKQPFKYSNKPSLWSANFETQTAIKGLQNQGLVPTRTAYIVTAWYGKPCHRSLTLWDQMETMHRSILRLRFQREKRKKCLRRTLDYFQSLNLWTLMFVLPPGRLSFHYCLTDVVIGTRAISENTTPPALAGDQHCVFHCSRPGSRLSPCQLESLKLCAEVLERTDVIQPQKSPLGHPNCSRNLKYVPFG